ncbi:hypothetical protein [Bdellovibrio bacteriovorus]|uniref:hypothetical protein n=1 Tax=Bdellovibrio bacteriovorus TaxID=959 RepID=UPI0035A5D5EE
MSTLKCLVALGCALTIVMGCQQPLEEASTTANRYLYVSSGLCYSGPGITTFTAATASNLVYKINTATGVRESIIADFSAFPATAGDTPISIVNWDDENLVVFVRNVNAGSLQTLPKLGGDRNIFGTNPAMSTIISTAPKGMIKSSDGGLLMIRTGFIEKINSTGVRQNTPYVNSNLGATCGTANTYLTNMAISSTGRIITANGAASPNNRVISVPAAGASGSCSAGLAAPTAATYATDLVFDKANGKLIVAYAGATTAANVNSIHAYDFDESTGAISNDQVIYDANASPSTYNYLLFGISAMTLDEETNTLYVATAISNATTVVNYAIEKFSYDATKIGTANSEVLTRSGTVPFYNYGIDTKCISSMTVGTDPTEAAD